MDFINLYRLMSKTGDLSHLIDCLRPEAFVLKRFIWIMKYMSVSLIQTI